MCRSGSRDAVVLLNWALQPGNRLAMLLGAQPRAAARLSTRIAG
jgi:hypothetical protein